MSEVEWVVVVDISVWAESEEEAARKIESSGFKTGELIGEVQINSVDRPEEL